MRRKSVPSEWRKHAAGPAAAVFGVAAAASAALLAAGVIAASAGTGSSGTAAQNKAAARAVVAFLMRTKVELPPGAVRVHADAGVGSWLSGPSGVPATPNVVDVHRYWRVPGDFRSVFAWISRHRPPGATTSGSGRGATYGRLQMLFVQYEFPGVPGTISQESVAIAVSAARGGDTAVRADAWAVWVTPRPAWERVPAGIRSVAVFADRLDGRVFPVGAVTAPGQIASLIAYADSRPLLPPGARSCPIFSSTAVLFDLRFESTPGASPAARIVQDGCAGLSAWIGARRGPQLEEDSSLMDLLWRLGALPVCTAAQLRGSASPPTRYTRPPEVVTQLLIRNVSPAVCGLRGVARLTLLDPHRRPLRTRVTHSHLPASVAVLGPGGGVWMSLTSPPPHPGCAAPRAAFVNVTLPGVAQPIVIRVGSVRHPLAPCGGRLRVDPI
jgi:hypothetical protein